MGRILRNDPPLPVVRERMHGVFQHQQASALLWREIQRVGSLAPAPAPQLLVRSSLQPIAEQRAGGDAVRATVDLEAQRHDAIVAYARAREPPHTCLYSHAPHLPVRAVGSRSARKVGCVRYASIGS